MLTQSSNACWAQLTFGVALRMQLRCKSGPPGCAMWILVDLTDAVAEALNQPFAAISIEMVYRSLYFFTQAHARGQADNVVAYLADNTKLLGIQAQTQRRTSFAIATDPDLDRSKSTLTCERCP